jgi:predicted ATPase/DNA-binding winged helix-turn-helix (wHTH) protein
MSSASLRFADHFELQPQERRLLVEGKLAALGARALDVLIALAERAGQLVSKNELIDLAWPGLVVEENNLQVQISALRKVLGGEIIATIPGRGYRFTARVHDTLPAPPPSPAPLSPPATEVVLRTNLPASLPPLLGRDDDLAALGSLIEHHHLVTIVGAGGMGKTRLAQALLHARRGAYPHGVCWVELAPVADGAALPGAIAAALGVRLGAGEPLDGLAAALAAQTLLIALDNAEHLLADTARVVKALHGAAPGLHIVVTSQASLKLPPERVYRLGALSTPQGPVPAAEALDFGAVALFVERAQAADARFVLTDANAPAVIELCRALDGLALAIELAAARAPMLGVQRLAASLDERLRLLTTSRNRDAPARQQTLRAALEWSHGFLDERERAVFRRLAVIAGSASLDVIQQVAADPPGDGELDEWAVLDALTVLIERSLVAPVGIDDADMPPRYRLLDSPRAFARELLAAAGETETVAMRHARAVVALCDRLHAQRFSGEIGVDAWEERARADLDNAREALGRMREQGDGAAVLAIIAALLLALPKTLHTERNALCDTFDTVAGQASAARWLRAGFEVGAQRMNGADESRAQAHIHRVIAFARERRDDTPDTRFDLYRALGLSLSTPPTDRETEAAELRALEDPAWPAQRLHYGLLGLMFNTTEPQERLRLGQRLVANGRVSGYTHPIYLSNLIDAQVMAGDPHAAVRTGTALLAQLQGSRDEYALAYARLNTAAAHLALGETGAFRALAEQSWQQAAHVDLQLAWCDHLAVLAALERRPRAAARLAGCTAASHAIGHMTAVNEAQANARAQHIAREALGDAEFERLTAEGALLRNTDIPALAFATVDAP